jgi:hypothetical protein
MSTFDFGANAGITADHFGKPFSADPSKHVWSVSTFYLFFEGIELVHREEIVLPILRQTYLLESCTIMHSPDFYLIKDTAGSSLFLVA